MLPSITYLDLETTGATPLTDRITEIALVRFDNGIEVARWQTLVNPEQAISPFIQQLTGIDNEMVANAPTFAQVSDKLLGFLEGTVLAAHNVRFDHGFIKAELNRLGYTLRQKVLCTVKLSRLLYPQHRSHGLDTIMQRHNITSVARHRAMGDVESVLSFLASAKLELGDAAIINAAKQLMRGPALPAHLDAVSLEDMPESPGVYLFYGENDLPIYISKGANIRTRVYAHLSPEKASAKEMRISQETKRVEWIETAGEFSALLLETRLVKAHQPVHNRQLRNEQQLCSWKLNADANAKPALELVHEADINPAELGQFFGTFKSKKQAVAALRKIAEAHQLCPKILGLELGEGACFSTQTKRCKGVCCGRESPQMHHLRLQQALLANRLKVWTFSGKIGIREHHSENSHEKNKSQMHIFEHWCYLGVIDSAVDLTESIQHKSVLRFDLDTYRLLLKAFDSRKLEIFQFPK